MERCIIYAFIVIMIVLYFVQDTTKAFTYSDIEQFEDHSEYQKIRQDLLHCGKFDCLYNKEIICENWCNKLDTDSKKTSCLYNCYNYTENKINYIKYQEAIFGGAIYDFNLMDAQTFIKSITDS